MESRARGKFNAQIYEQACDWFGECRSGGLDAAARRDFDRWLRQSPDHIAAYLEVAALYQEARAAIPETENVEALIAAAARHHDNVVELAPDTPTRQVPTSLPSPRKRTFAVTASLAIAAAVLVIVSQMSWPQTYATGIGEQRSIVLADGSTVDLNSRSKIRIRFSSQQRGIELIDGQALFKVARDHARPFVVESGGTRVRAVGTQFDVYRKRQGTIVTVVEGRVAVLTERGDGDATVVEPQTGALGPGLLVSAGEQVKVNESTAQRLPHPNIDGATAWRQRELVFDTASLFEVAEEFNRYNTRRLVIDKDEQYDFHISGVFSSTDPSSLIRFLQARRDLRVIETETEIRVGKNN
ncbi:MAG TPA: FecR family protein [Steroidobacter sp.]|uniref:FecR family protein n=1 Tax=Steroidobacter sp. TaxID=1978227 RepID=UPI002ED7A132